MKLYTKYPKSVIQQAALIVQICDDYWSNQIDENTLRFYINEWKVNGQMFNNFEKLYPTLIKIIGRKRLRLCALIFNKDQSELI